MSKRGQKTYAAEERRRISVLFDPPIFRRLDIKRTEDDTTFQEVASKLLLEWLEGRTVPPPPFPDLTAEERRLLCDVLHFWRTAPQHDSFRDVLPAVLNAWARKNP